MTTMDEHTEYKYVVTYCCFCCLRGYDNAESSQKCQLLCDKIYELRKERESLLGRKKTRSDQDRIG